MLPQNRTSERTPVDCGSARSWPNQCRRVLLISLMAGMLVLAATAVDAAPITFRFEATVTQADDFSQSSLPFALEPGDSLAGQLSFDSVEDLRHIFAMGVAPASEGTLHLRFHGLDTFHAFNSGSPQPLFDINNPPTEPRSGITLGWTPTTDVFPAFSGSYQSNAVFSLTGQVGIIDDLDDALDFEKWNDLTESRILSLSFGFPNTVTVQATIGEITRVPEPNTTAVTLILIPILTAAAARIRKIDHRSPSSGPMARTKVFGAARTH